jgi:antitoxin HicB
MNDEVKGAAGSTVESWLEEEGLLEEATAAAIKSVLAWQLREEMRARGISKTRMAELLKSSRTQVDRILDPDNVTVSFDIMNRAAKVVGRKLRVELV